MHNLIKHQQHTEYHEDDIWDLGIFLLQLNYMLQSMGSSIVYWWFLHSYFTWKLKIIHNHNAVARQEQTKHIFQNTKEKTIDNTKLIFFSSKHRSKKYLKQIPLIRRYWARSLVVTCAQKPKVLGSIARIMSMCLWSEWKCRVGLKTQLLHSTALQWIEHSWNKIQIEKKPQKTRRYR